MSGAAGRSVAERSEPARAKVAYLEREGMRRLLERARDRFERNGGPRGTVRIDRLDSEEAEALNGLLAPRVPYAAGGEARVKLERLDRELRSSRIGLSLEQALVAIGGSLADLPAERADRVAEREGAWAAVLAHPEAGRAGLGPWLEHARRFYGGADPDRAALVGRALDVLAALPVDGLDLAELAATRAGDDAHALDRDRTLGRLVAAALVALEGGDPAESLDAKRWRAVWEGVGVSCDELSCTALALGVRPSWRAHGYLARRLRAATRRGAPIVLTLRELRRELPLLSGEQLFVCENPSVVSAAARELGRHCPPLLCTGGWPNAAVALMLEAARQAGMSARVSTDRDPAGAAIAERVLVSVDGRPWLEAEPGSPRDRDGAHEESMLGSLIAAMRDGA